MTADTVNAGSKRKGFTLIEILVAIAIVTILSGLVIASTRRVRSETREKTSRQEMAQLMKAAEIALSNFGYYPNDSHGSIICPMDIVLDQVSGAVWGDIIGLCTDPYGNPYEWNNICANGLQRKADGSNASCPPFSDSNAGAIGITMIGEDGVNNNCTGDDICYGDRGHELYRWDRDESVESEGGGGEEEEGGGGSCATTSASCESLSTLACVTRSGCELESLGCEGSYPGACGAFSDQSSCQSEAECTWDVSGSCGGTPPSCSTYGAQSSCSAASGCSWQACSGTPNACTSYGNSTSCGAAGCTWGSSGGSCSGSALSCSTWNGNQAVCATQQGCTYNTGNNRCNGTHAACTTFGTSGTCSANLNCSWTAAPNSCSGTPSACSTYSSGSSCTAAGCSGLSCSGTATPCDSYGGSSSCSAVSGCSWTAGGACTGEYTNDCGTFGSALECNTQAACSWQNGSCSGTAASCGTFSTQLTCQVQGGCAWQ